MFYKLLGMAVWQAGKLFLRSRYGSVTKPLLAGAAVVVAAGAGIVVAALRHSSDDE